MASVSKHRNRWRIKWRDENGRSLYESYPTQMEAEQAARAIEARTVLDGRAPAVPDGATLTLARWWDRWEPGRQWRPSTRAQHDTHWRKWIAPVFGAVPIDTIAAADVRRWHRKLEDRGLALSTIGTVHRTLSMVLQGAVEDRLLDRNPASVARLRQPPKTPPVALDPATVTALLDTVAATTPRMAPYARLIAATGLRRAEAAGLTWSRVDLDAARLTVDRQLDYMTSNQPAWAPTKNSATRRVPLTAATVDDLRTQRRAQQVATISGEGLVFCRDDGSPWPKRALQDAWTRAAKKLAEDGTPLPPGARGWHALRHTIASRLLESGVPPAEIAQMLGHSVGQLLATYAHVTDRAAADDRLRAALGD